MKCLCPIYQKFYNSLKSINELKANNSFFDNIALVDNFFLEFRNITFVLQKHLQTEEEKIVYRELKSKYLENDSMKWFVEKRNEVSKEKSFELKKKFIVDIYCIKNEKNIISETITIENDDLNSKQINDKITKTLSNIETSEPEIFLTIKYEFLNNTEEIDIHKTIKNGINTMYDFILEFDKKIKNDCKICDKLKGQIDNKIKEYSARRMELVTDCSYNVKNNKLEFYDKADIYYGNKSDNFFYDGYRIPIKDNPIFKSCDTLDEFFKSFIIAHVPLYVMQQHHIMPTFLIVYSDETFSINSYFAFNKATHYRKVNEIAKKIMTDDIIAIMCVNESLSYSARNENIYDKTYKERIKYATKEMLVFTIIQDNLKEKNICFDTSKIDDLKYVMDIIKNGEIQFVDMTLQPIREIFNVKNQKNN